MSVQIIALIALLSISIFCAGFICSNEIVIRLASRAEGYRTNRGKTIRMVD